MSVEAPKTLSLFQPSSNLEAFPRIFNSDQEETIKIAIQILSACITTINEFYCVSLVSRRFRALAQHPDVIRHLFSRSIFELWPRRYPMPACCSHGRVILQLKGLSREEMEAAMAIHPDFKTVVHVGFGEGEVTFVEHPHLYVEDITEDTIAFLCKYAKNAADLKVVFKNKNFFIADRLLNKLVSTVQGISELYLGDHEQNWGCMHLPTDDLEGTTDAGLVNLGFLSGLRALTLRVECNQISAKTFERLRACTRLEKLIFGMQDTTCMLNPEELAQIGRLTSLTELSVPLYKNSSPGLSELTRLQRLQTFTMHNSAGHYWRLENDALFQSLAMITSLTSLSMERMRNVDNQFMELLMTSLPRLQSLSLSDIGFSSEGLSYIALNSTIRHLAIFPSLTRLEDIKKALANWANCPKLESLTLHVSPFDLETTGTQELFDLLERSRSLRSVTFRSIVHIDLKSSWPRKRLNQGYRRDQEGEFTLDWSRPT